SPELDGGEAGPKQVQQLAPAQLAHVERVRPPGRVRINVAIGRGEQEEAILLQAALDDPEEAIVIRDVLDRLEAGDHVEAAGGERVPVQDRTLHEGQVAAAVRAPAVLDRQGVDVDADDLGRVLRHDRGAKALATGEVEHTFAAHQLRGEVISMEVLVDDLDV